MTDRIHTLADGRIVAVFHAGFPQTAQIRIFDASGTELTSGPVRLDSGSTEPDTFLRVVGVTGGPGDTIRVLYSDGDTNENRVQTFNPNGTLVGAPALAGITTDYPIDGAGRAAQELSNGRHAILDGEDLVLVDRDGDLLGITAAGTVFRQVFSENVLQVGNRIFATWVVSIDNDGGSETDGELRGRFYDLNGVAQGAAFEINAPGQDILSTRGQNLESVDAVQLSDGRIAVTWAMIRDTDSADVNQAVWVTVLNADGSVSVPERLVNVGDTDGVQYLPDIFALTGGGFAITYSSIHDFPAHNRQETRVFDGVGNLTESRSNLAGNGGSSVYVHINPDGSVYLLDFAGSHPLGLVTPPPPTGPVTFGGTEGADTFTGGVGDDNISGGAGNDVLDGGGGNDTVNGGIGFDTIYGGSGSDRLDGGDGSDRILAGDGADTVIGGLGDDFLFGGASDVDLRDVIFGGDGNDSIDGRAGNDELNGGNGNDTVIGGLGSDTLVGNEGNDLIGGSGGSDLMSGNAGNDTLNGGFGYDRMNGGAGADSFYHLGVADHASDWIQDYNTTEGDVLMVGLAGATRSQFQVNRTFTPNAGDAGVQEAFIIYRPTGQILWALVDGGDDAVISVSIGGQVFDLMA